LWQGSNAEKSGRPRLQRGAAMSNLSNRLPVLATEIRKAHADVQDAAKTAAQRALEAGHALIEAKELMDHGGWLPWLREHCALADRTARLYMQIARSGLKSAMVADLGLQAAAKAIVLQYPDPFDGTPSEELHEWRLYLLWGMQHGYRGEDAEHYCERLKRNGWTCPSEWVGEAGDRLRKAWGMAALSAESKADWFSFLAKNCNMPMEDIKAEAIRLKAAEPPPEAVSRKGRSKLRRISAGRRS
jgi:Protein of unknown function (DUF3102)